MSTTRPRVAVTTPPGRIGEVLDAAALDRLHRLAEPVFGEGDTAAIGARLGDLLADAEVCLTGWGSPPLGEAHLDRAPRLRLIAHAAGSVRHLVPAAAFTRGIAVCHAARFIAEAVAEMTLLMLLGLRDVHRLDRAMKAGQPWSARPAGHESHRLTGRAIGLIGGGYVARQVIRLLAPFEPVLRVYDPYLPPDQAAALGAQLVPLDTLLRQSEVVSVHAPITPETCHLIGARQLALLRDGALFINTARAWVVDQAALLEELRAGRIRAALDVFEPEPLPLDSPFRQLDSVILTPHVAGNTLETRLRQGQAMLDEIERFASGAPLQHRIRPEQYAIMA